MASTRLKKKSSPISSGNSSDRARPLLRVVSGGPPKRTSNPESSALSELFSSSLSRARQKPKRGKKQELAPIDLPKALGKYSDLFAAGKALLKEIEFKVGYAEQRIRDFCVENYVKLFASLKSRPPSLDFKGATSSFKFVQTHRTTLTAEKVHDLKDLGVPIDDFTELVGIEVNMAAIRQHKLEDKLQSGLATLGVAPGVIEECFTPRHELSPRFYDNLFAIVQGTIGKGEDAQEKIEQVFQILNPSSQIRNVETKLNREMSFKYVDETEIESEFEPEFEPEPGPGLEKYDSDHPKKHRRA